MSARYHASGPPPDFSLDGVPLANVSSELERTVQAALLVADDLDRKGYLATGVIRCLARLATQRARHVGHDRCPIDGRAVVQPATGRRRTYCSAACKRAASRK